MHHHDIDYQQLAVDVKRWGRELGFQQIGIADTELRRHEKRLHDWLAAGYHGEMTWMAAHGNKRSRPDELLPGTLRVISARMDYLPGDTHQAKLLQQKDKAYLARYALGRDYHKLIRKRLSELADKITAAVGNAPQQRPFVDSAPVLERAIAEKSGLGWIGKNTMLINNKAGSWFFLGELFTTLPLPVENESASNHCGSCRACLDICPTRAFVGPYQLDARKCISYLTIEHKGSIPEHLRKAMGNRVFGCDDCQMVCPWNKFAKPTDEGDFKPRHNFDAPDLAALFSWGEAEFLQKTEGSPIRRIGYERWLRNLAVGLGNGPSSTEAINALQARLDYPSALVREHVEWALGQHRITLRIG
ncbi:MAG: tRNA epoxyqueuosine(34) reductase QueG [Cellvibrionaceae bacterium]